MNSSIYSLQDLLKMPNSKQAFLIDPILPQVGVAMLYGPSDSGKSFLCKQISIAIANGESKCLEFPSNTKAQKVLHLLTEEIDVNSLSYKAKMQENGYPCSNPDNIKYLIALTDPMKELDEALNEDKFDLVIVDCWADTVKGDINQISVARGNTMKYREMAYKHSCCILLIHHQNKSGGDNSANKKYVSGSQAIEASMRSVIDLRKGTGNEKWLTIVKGNDIKDDLKNGYYILETDDNMVYSFKDFTGPKSSKKGKYFDDPELCKLVINLKKEGHSCEDIHKTLLGMNSEYEIPGLTTIKNFLAKSADKFIEMEEENEVKRGKDSGQ